MYYFRYWAPENSPHRGRFYVEGGDGEYLCVVNGRPAVRGTSTDLRRVLILRFLHENGIGIGASGIRGMRELGDELVRCRLLLGGRWAAQRANADVDDGYRFLDLPPADLYRASLTLDAAAIECRAETIKEGGILVDYRQPSTLFDGLARGPLRVDRQDVSWVDVVAFRRDGIDLAVFVRKTVTELYNGITGDDRRCYEQAELLWDEVRQLEADGYRVRVVWVIEAEHEGRRQLYNALPEITQMERWMHYMVGVLGYHVVTTFSTNHSAYLIAIIIAGFLENSLLVPVTVNGERIDKGRDEREAMMGRPAVTDEVPTDHGVIQDSHSLASLLASFPGVSARVARWLAATGLSLAEIAALEEDALLKIDGIGATTAAHLRHLFHSLRGSTQPPVRAKRGAKRKQKT